MRRAPAPFAGARCCRCPPSCLDPPVVPAQFSPAFTRRRRARDGCAHETRTPAPRACARPRHPHTAGAPLPLPQEQTPTGDARTWKNENRTPTLRSSRRRPLSSHTVSRDRCEHAERSTKDTVGARKGALGTSAARTSGARQGMGPRATRICPRRAASSLLAAHSPSP